jgi:hypothetical protein
MGWISPNSGGKALPTRRIATNSIHPKARGAALNQSFMLVEASVERACKDTAAWNPFWQPLAAKLITASNGGNNRYFREWLATPLH